MTDSKNNEKDSRIPYEPPRLFDLGGGVAYAAAPGACSPGGSPTAGQCTPGSAATGGKCQSGGAAGSVCQNGSGALGGKCQSGQTASGKCTAGGVPGK